MVIGRHFCGERDRLTNQKDMNTIELALVVVAAAGLMLWRGVAMYRYAFRRHDL